MFRAILFYLSKATWARRLVTEWRFARTAASRFIAGDTLDEALETIRNLNDKGLFVTIDHLGENVFTTEEAIRAKDYYLETLAQIESSKVEANVSVKLSQMGLNIDFNLCLDNMRCIALRAVEFGIMVRIDIEDSPVVDRTWQIYRSLSAEGVTNVGLAIQSYLYRSEEDVRALANEGAYFRLCKGAYKEPANVAFPRKADVDANFDLLAKILIDATLVDGAEPVISCSKIPPVTAIATHDIKRIDFARDYAMKVGLPKRALEFQMLLGIRGDIQQSLVDEGYPVRIYVPHGTEWYPYFTRRLAERPANLWFFLSNFFRG